MRRLVDRGAITAAWVGVGMAVTIAISFLLVIPIEIVFLLFGLPAGLLIGYYANARSERDGGPFARIVSNGLFFGLDNGYRDASVGPPLTCATGAECVYARYAADAGYAERLAAAGVTDPASFTSFYWGEQTSNAGYAIGLVLVGGLGGALAFVAARGRKPAV